MPPKKNPVAARIKKIMQADDEVGKIAQATPVLVYKALELFMEELVKSTADVALARGAKMISAGHLKACITSNEKFDFLEEIVQGVPDLPAADEAKPAATKTAKRERAAPNPAVAGSLDDDDYGAPPPIKVMRTEAPGTLDEEAPALAAAPAVGSLGVDDLDVPVAAPSAVGTLTGTLGEDDDYDDL